MIEDSGDSIENYEQGRLMVIARYYAENYNEEIVNRIAYIENINLAKSLDGWEELEKNFNILNVYFGISLSYPYENILSITVKSKSSYCVGGLSWENPFSNNVFSYNWNDMIGLYKKINQVACRHNWATDWLRSGTHRSLWAYAYGSSPSNIDSVSISESVWKDAGLNGQPYYEIGMLDGDSPVGDFYISKDGENAAIVTLQKTKGDRWINEQEISYFPTSVPRSFVVVKKMAIG